MFNSYQLALIYTCVFSYCDRMDEEDMELTADSGGLSYQSDDMVEDVDDPWIGEYAQLSWFYSLILLQIRKYRSTQCDKM